MKTILILLILSSALAIPAIGALDDADLNKIRLIVNEVVKKEITDSEARMKEYIDLKIDGVDKQFEGVDKQFEGVGKQITLLTNVVYGLIALIVAAIAIPQIIMAWRSGKDREQARINQELREEIETLKQQRIVQP
jgi:hypothetical protein